MARATAVALVDRLIVDGVSQKDVINELMQRRNAAEALCTRGLQHPDEDVRHLAAELLRDLESTSAVPSLIEALRDKSPHVRFDVLSALSETLKVDVGWWLRIEAYHDTPKEMHRRVKDWWRINKHYVWW